MKITLKDNPLLLRFIKSRKKSSEPEFLSYAEIVENEIIDPETRRLTGKYNVDKFELVLIGTKPLSSFKIRARNLTQDGARRLLLLKFILRGKRIYISRLNLNADCFEYTPPEQISFSIETPDCKRLKIIDRHFQKKQKPAIFGKAHLKKINNYLIKINREAVNSLILSAKRDFEFISHFNSEMFYQNISAKGLQFSKETVLGIYEDERYMKIIDLSDPRERMGFISLYAIAFYNLSLNDLYSVEGIFTLQPNRETDEKKRLAGQDVFGLIFSENREEIRKRVSYMGEAIKKLPLPEIDLNINSIIKKNYTLYCGAGDMGKAFSRLILNMDNDFERTVKTARRLSRYKLLESLYEEMLSSDETYTESAAYKRAADFAGAAAGKKTAGELDFAVKDTNIML